MSIAFSRSLRSLNNDRFRPALIALIVSVILVLAWCAWFFLARVTLYEVSTTFEVQRDGTLRVEFPAEALARIESGQAAWLQLSSQEDGQPQTLPALVMNAPYASSDTEAVEVHVFTPDPLDAKVKGQVRVEVASISPARLVLQAAGQFVEDPELSLSPRKP